MLPIYDYRDEIIATIRKNQVTVIVGETGSGKTTQLPRFLYEACFSTDGVIGIIEPRRVAATSVAEYVALQLETKLGGLVGYKVRHDHQTSEKTKIRFMTDGILLRELQDDPMLSEYSVIMIDEAHERSVNIDFVLGLIKDLLSRRSDLKLIVSSATIDTVKFADYFAGAPVIEVSGRTFPVEVIYNETDTTWYRHVDLYAATVNRVVEIHRTQPEGDILVFMPGAEEINALVGKLELSLQDEVVILPAHGGVPPQDLRKIFNSYFGKRKIVVATNIAETSITIDGVVYVVDTGLVKQTHFDVRSGLQSLDIVEHSQSGCDQRKGRAGRTRPGKCYRMFTEDTFVGRPRYTEPEICRSSLAGVVLAMENIGITDVENFDFIDPPERAAFHDAYQTLIALGAVNSEWGGLTPIGHEMASLPLEPRAARMVLEAREYNCVREIVTVVAFMSVRNVFIRPRGREYEADAAHDHFRIRRSDALTFLRIWEEYEAFGFDRDWCFEHFLNGKALHEVKRVRSQLLDITAEWCELTTTGNDEAVMKSVAAGLIQNLARSGSYFRYNGALRDFEAYIFPGSSVFGAEPQWMVCAEVVYTKKPFARMVSSVEVGWLPELAPDHFYQGPIKLAELGQGGETVIAVRPIFQRKVGIFGEDREIGHVDLELSIEEAVCLQRKAIEKAKRAGYEIFTFEVARQDGFSYLSDLVTFHNGTSYTASYRGINPQRGKVYYGSIEPKEFGSGREVVLRLELVDIPGHMFYDDLNQDRQSAENDKWTVSAGEPEEAISTPTTHNEMQSTRKVASADELAALAAHFNKN